MWHLHFFCSLTTQAGDGKCLYILILYFMGHLALSGSGSVFFPLEVILQCKVYCRKGDFNLFSLFNVIAKDTPFHHKK